MKKLFKKKTMLFLPLKKRCQFSGEPSVLEVAIANQVPLNHSCGGMGSCTTCRIEVLEGAETLAPRNEVEQEHAQMRGYKSFERLSCQTTAVDGLVALIPAVVEDEDGSY